MSCFLLVALRPPRSLGTADGVSILGNGTSADPFRTAAVGSKEIAIPPGLHPTFVPGQPVRVTTAAQYAASVATARDTATVTGLVSANEADGIHIQYADALELTEAEWNAVTGGSGGLTVGAYYLSAAGSGLITTVAPAGAGSYVTQVGQAISSTKMLINPSAPVGPHA